MSLPSQPILHRTLSHENDADDAASTYFHQCKDGDTILSNYWTTNDFITYAYFRKVGEQFIKFQTECFRPHLPAFTFYVSYPSYDTN
jgi:hypothetical protein